LYSPDQLRIRHKLIPGVPLESQIISLQEQLQQAESLGVELTSKQLEEAYPLLGPAGPVKVWSNRTQLYTDSHEAIEAAQKGILLRTIFKHQASSYPCSNSLGSLTLTT
jgi:hypothetical protein